LEKLRQPHREVGSAQDELATIPPSCSRSDDLQVKAYAAVTLTPTETTAPAVPSSGKSYRRETPVIRRNRITDFSFIWPRSMERGWFTDCFNFLEGTPQASSENYSLQCLVVKLYDCLANVIEVSFSLLDWVKYHDPHSF
jgi:hypothetical protein